MGANAEKQQDFEAAVRFYREALAMEPMRNDCGTSSTTISAIR